MKFYLFLLCTLIFSGPIAAQTKSSERKAILDALRHEVQKELKQSVTFKVDHLSSAKGWAFMTGIPQQKNGKSIDYTKTSYKDAVEAGAFDDGIAALLVKLKGKWTVKVFVIGATDVPWVCWWKEFKAPPEIFIAVEDCND
jgi:hypothetical protein